METRPWKLQPNAQGSNVTLTLPEAINQAVNAYIGRDWGKAEQLCRRVLNVKADYFDALNLLGIITAQTRRLSEAADLLGRAVAVQPNNVSALSNLGALLKDLKRSEEAIVQLDRAIALKPDYAEAYNNRGNALKDLGRLNAAVESFDRALALKPDFAEACNNRGVALQELRQLNAAVESFDRALALKPDFAEAYSNRGNALNDLRQLEAAVESIDRAIALRPDYAEAYNNRGNALVDLKRLDAAVESYDRAIALKPDYAEALYGRATALWQRLRYQEAIADLKTLLATAPLYDYARGWLLHIQLHCCEWADYGQAAARVVEDVRIGRRADHPFCFQSVSDSAADQLRCSQIFTTHKFPAAATPIWRGERYGHDRIRLAYLSADFRTHPSSFLLAGMFELHDRSRFETIAISFGDDDQSEIRTRLKGAFERFIDVRAQSDLEVARLMRDLEIDIAVDLMGHTQYQRTGILALRPAPVQVNFFCPGTSGAAYLDYIVCDRVVIPEDHHAHYSEKVVYLPDTFQANDFKRRIAEHAPSRAEAGLPDEGFVFCSFNNTYKFTPSMFDIWMRLLRRVEGGVLWLQQANAAATDNLRREAARRGIEANRLVFAPRVPRLEDHLARYRLADLFLDTLPYNAQTTASDALWTGLPVITCLGTTFVGRVAASLLNAVGLPELITHSLEEYESLALELATHPAKLADLRARLARNRATFPLFDTDRFRRHIESAYITMWERHRSGAAPESFSVQPVRQTTSE